MRRAVPSAKLQNAVESFLTALLREAAAAPKWFMEVKEHVEANTASTLREIGRSVGRHPAHIMREFRRREGVPLGEYQRALRIASACRMLRQSRRSLADIALACGFADQSHFTRTFKRFVNMTPHAYRKA
jgi:AraC family transcriptional regulator